MRTPAGTECKYYYEDFYRRSFQECRLIARNPESLRWSPDLCAKCPVPSILLSNSCSYLLLKATVVRQFLVQKRVKVEAYCEQHQRAVADPEVGCGECVKIKPVNSEQ